MFGEPLRALLAVLVLALLLLCGCDSRDSFRLAAVHGTVAYREKLLDRGQVVFLPERGTPGPPAIGDIRPDGSYELRTLQQAGASIGRHRVLVHLRRLPTNAEQHQLGIVLESLIPEKYSRENESPLRFEVKAGTNEYFIVLE